MQPISQYIAHDVQATMICGDNSEWMSNEDYPPSRFEAQADAFSILCGAKTQAKESMVGLPAMAARKGVIVLVTLTNDFSKVLLGMNGLKIGGEANLTAAIQVAQLVLKNQKNKQLLQGISVFAGSYDLSLVNEDLLTINVKKLKKNDVSLHVVDFDESDDEKPEKLEALAAAVTSGGNSHIIHIPVGDVFSDVIISSPILSEYRGSDSAAAKLCVDRELEEERKQEAAAKKAREELSKTEGQSSASNGDIAMAETEPEPNSYTKDERLLHMDADELLRLAHELSELLEGVKATTALQRAFQKEETGTQSDASTVFADQLFAQSLPDAELLNNLSNKDQLTWSERRSITSRRERRRGEADSARPVHATVA